jgi:hypothetical protein
MQSFRRTSPRLGSKMATDRPPAPKLIQLSPRLLGIAVGCAAVGALLVGSIAVAVRGCRGGGRLDSVEQRVARIEGVLGMAEAGPELSADAAAADTDGGAVPIDDRTAACAVAKVAAYQAWQDALAKAKTNAAPAEAACADMWSDKKKQACYYGASAGPRTAQAARDAVMKGGAAARDAVKNVKDDPKNDAVARARASSEAAFTACRDDNEY